MKSIVKLFAVVIGVLCLNISSAYSTKKLTPVDYVNPYMGNISHLLVPTYPTIHLPNSLLRVYPQRDDFTGDRLHGLPLIITSHRGRSAFNLSAFSGTNYGMQPVVNYSYDNEDLTPYSYKVYLDEEKLEVNYAVAEQSAIYSFNFLKNQAPHLRFNVSGGEVAFKDGAIQGKQNMGNNTWVHIYAISDVKPNRVQILNNGAWADGTNTNGETACVDLVFNANSQQINFKYGISFISINQAKENLEREIKGFDLTKVAKLGKEKWNKELGKIAVETDNVNDKAIFYTSMYRTMERPVKISEGGKYFSAFDGKVHSDNGEPFYTDDWVWDSYRAHHPLNVILDDKKEQNIVKSFIRMSQQMKDFWLPTFPEINGDSRRMNSNHGVAVILDAYQKGIKDFDLQAAYKAAKGAITEKTLAPWSGKPAGELDKFFYEKGYIPALRDGEKETIAEVDGFERRQPVAVTLGTAYDLWCLAQIAKILGYQDDYEKFNKLSLNYRNLFNKQTKFFHPKDKDGNFIEPFDYAFSGGQGARGFYGENNGWIYRWDVQHNIPDLIQLMGGNKAFVYALDDMFNQPLGRSKYEFYAQMPDHTGNVGQFSMANEPSLHIPYLYNYAGQAWKTQKRVKHLVRQWFRNDLMGMPGDEDGGGMSAFVAFSQLGFYPVTPGIPVYSIGTPFFTKATIKLNNGKTFTVQAKNVSEHHKYIKSAQLNGKALAKAELSHDQLMEGGVLVFEMTDKPSDLWNEIN